MLVAEENWGTREWINGGRKIMIGHSLVPRPRSLGTRLKWARPIKGLCNKFYIGRPRDGLTNIKGQRSNLCFL